MANSCNICIAHRGCVDTPSPDAHWMCVCRPVSPGAKSLSFSQIGIRHTCREEPCICVFCNHKFTQDPDLLIEARVLSMRPSLFALVGVILTANMASRPSASSAIVPLDNKRRRTASDIQTARSLLAQSSKTKKQLVDTLAIMKNAGKLEEGITKKELTEASEHHAKQKTRYGTVVQQIEVGMPGLKFLDICHPFAMLQYLCTISLPFGDMLYTAVQKAAGQPLRLVIYADEMCPGNPFRPEKSRTLQCIYWTFIDFPGYVLSRTFSWKVLCLIRAKIVEKVEGGMSYICRLLLRVFFPENGTSLADGIYVKVRDATFVVSAVFAGFLCDLKGHKENLEWKGHNGNVTCLSCANIDKRILGDHGARVYGLDCSDPKKFIPRTNEEVFEAVDELAVLKTTRISKTAFEARETEVGFNLCLGGILLDA